MENSRGRSGVTSPSVYFARPPVVEVVAGITFTNYTTDFSAILAAFWKEVLRDQFPVLQQQPPYAPPEEQFQEQPSAGFSFQLGGGYPAPRLWASNSDGSELIQLQPDWFARNWRKVKPEDEYDRWPSRRTALTESFAELERYADSNEFPRPLISQCEVSYINHISLDGFADGWGSIGAIMQGQSRLSRAAQVEQAALQVAYVLQGESQPAGRLHVSIKPALNAEGQPIYVLELTARSVTGQKGFHSALSFLDKGREAINTAFVALTTEEMHEKWGIRE
ncbi:MAG: TIGR04255 family protein [Actinobacteria bacterium]|nr:TIGR04255 family protein [Acidobacteriota bacterium]MCA1707017.1 TIGR04255 family protein [Actinomycetota bacterium]